VTGAGGQLYKSRRMLSVFTSDGTPTTGALTCPRVLALRSRA
jgi:hypothetical protein